MVVPGEIAAVVRGDGDSLLELSLPATGKASDNIALLKQRTMDFMTDFLKQKNMSIEEVDLMEEVVSDGEGEGQAKSGGKKGQKGKKRKQAASPAVAT